MVSRWHCHSVAVAAVLVEAVVRGAMAAGEKGAVAAVQVVAAYCHLACDAFVAKPGSCASNAHSIPSPALPRDNVNAATQAKLDIAVAVATVYACAATIPTRAG